MSVAGSTLYVHGELDTATAAALTDAAVRADVDELDLAAVTFIDAGGLAAVLAAVVDDETGPGLRLRAVSRAVIRILDLCDLVDVPGLVGMALGHR